jgi:hypothetical protein
MEATQVVLRTGVTVAAVAAAAELTPEAAVLLGQAEHPQDFMQRLLDAEHFGDAIDFLAHALPRREAVWWAWLCARAAAGESPPDPVADTLGSTHAWIAEPTDAYRRTAFACAELAGLGTPHGFAALAVFLSGDSLAPPNMEAVPPGPYDGAKAVAGAVALAAVAAKPDDPAGAFRDFIGKGLTLAGRTQLWHPLTPAGA